jgi:Polyketide cyclase / dehydrase and lipid transport
MHLHFSNQITINAPATKVWRVLAHEFASIGQWVSAIPHSQAVTDIPALDGAQVAGRVCATAVPGFDAVQEQFMYYDEQAMRFAYQATDGRPWFVKRAENHWVVRSLGPQISVAESRAELELSLFPGVFLSPLLKLLIGRVAAQFSEELKYYVEHDQPHPRKLKAQQKQMQKASARS